MIPKPLHNNASIIHYKIKNVIFINWWNIKKKKKKNTYMIPPAFTEVGKLVLQCVLENFKHNRYNGTQPPVS
jgi:hypothetical protein